MTQRLKNACENNVAEREREGECSDAYDDKSDGKFAEARLLDRFGGIEKMKSGRGQSLEHDKSEQGDRQPHCERGKNGLSYPFGLFSTVIKGNDRNDGVR